MEQLNLIIQDHLSNIVSFLSFAIASVSLYLSYLVFKRDQGKFRLSIYLGKMYPTENQDDDYLCFNVVNVGRRNLVATNIGGDYKYPIWKRCLSILPCFDYRPTSMILNVLSMPEISPLVTSTTGEPGCNYNEGKNIFVSAKLFNKDGSLRISKDTWEQLQSLYVLDSTGKKHYLGRNAFKQLVKGIMKMLKK